MVVRKVSVYRGRIAGGRMRRKLGGRRGGYALIMGLAATALLGMGALAIDSAYLGFAQAQSQAIADAGAHAATVSLRLHNDEEIAREAAVEFVGANRLLGVAAAVDAENDVIFGEWDFPTRTFDPTSSVVNSAQVQVRSTSDSPNGAIRPLLMGIRGSHFAEVASAAPSVGALRPREIMVVQDVTGSFRQEIGLARTAVLTFLDAIEDQRRPHDQIGMVTFVGTAEVWTDLSDVADNYSSIRSQWSTLDWCNRSYSPYTSQPANYHRAPQMMNCNAGNTYRYYYYDSGTAPGTGIDEAVDHFLEGGTGNEFAIRTIVLISDGKAECVYHSTDARAESICTAGREVLARAAATAADEEGISVYSVSYNETRDARQTALLESLVRGHGRFYETPDAAELPAILAEIANAIPTTLVR
jgi:Flp pilus assembly protein TadG